MFVLRLRQVPLVDASGATAIGNLVARRRQGIALIFTGLQPQPAPILRDMGIVADGATLRYADDSAQAVTMLLEPDLAAGLASKPAGVDSTSSGEFRPLISEKTRRRAACSGARSGQRHGCRIRSGHLDRVVLLG